MASSSNISIERFQITNSHGEKLAGVLHSTGSKGVVILSHGFRSSKDDDLILNLTAALTKNGFTTFCFDFAGNGESEGQFEYGNYRKEADDLHSILVYLSQKNFDVIAIVGHSKGRFDLRAGIKERFGEEFMQNIEKDGFVDVKDNKGTYRITKESLLDRLSINMPEEVKKIKEDCRVLTVHGTEDEIIPVQDAHEFAKIIPNHKLHLVNGANHCYTSHQTELASAVLDFLTSS